MPVISSSQFSGGQFSPAERSTPAAKAKTKPLSKTAREASEHVVYDGPGRKVQTGPGANDFQYDVPRRPDPMSGTSADGLKIGWSGQKPQLSGPTENRRVLHTEDLSSGEMSRFEQKHNEWREGAVSRMADVKLPESKAKKQAMINGVADTMTAKYGVPNHPAADYGIRAGETQHGEGFDGTARRILRQGADDAAYIAQRTATHDSHGSGWYFDQNSWYKKAMPNATPEELDRTMTAGSSMSPLNDPTQERKSAVALANAARENKPVAVTKAASKRTGVQAGEHGFNSLSSNDIRALGKSNNAQDVKAINKAVDAQAAIGGAGPNLARGVEGIRGAHRDSLNSPGDAAKVNIYENNVRNFSTPNPEHQQRYKDLTNQPLHPDAPVSTDHKRVLMSDQLADHLLGLHGKGTSSFNPDDRAVREIEANRGRTVHTDYLHPANVKLMGDKSVGALPGGEDARSAAHTSANHPTVIDSWVNAAVNGVRQASMMPEDFKAPRNASSTYKTGGSEPMYWTSNKLDNGTSLLDKPDPRIKPSAMNVASSDHVLRRAAHLAPEELGTKATMPSVGVQETLAWSGPRAVAGKDVGVNQRAKYVDSLRSQVSGNESMRGKQFGGAR